MTILVRDYHRRLQTASLLLELNSPGLLTLIEFVVRRALKREQAKLVGLHKENPKKATAKPTTERLLQAFANITLTIAQLPDRVMRHITPLTPLQVRTRSVELLGLSPDIYRALAENST